MALSKLFWLPNQPMFASEIIEQLGLAILEFEDLRDVDHLERLHRMKERLELNGVKI